MVQNLRACFILYAITMKLTIHVQEKIELPSMSQRPRCDIENIISLCWYGIAKEP